MKIANKGFNFHTFLENPCKGNATTKPPTVVTTAKPSPTTPSKKLVYHNIRLPKTIKPRNYTLNLEVDMSSSEVDGICEIVTDVEKATKYIMVHAVKFQSIDVTIKKHGTNENVEIKQTFLYAPNQYFVIEAAQIFEPGTYKLRFVYDFVLRKDLAGFYQSSYKTKTGEIR